MGVFVGLWTGALHAQIIGTPGLTTSSSTSSSSSTESPPACTTIGAQRTVRHTVIQEAIGPSCIGIGDRDLPNPAPPCGGYPASDPDPFHGTTMQVVPGEINTNTNVNTETITCVAAVPVAAPAAVPAMSWTTLWLAGLGLAGLAAWCLRRRSTWARD